MRALDLLNVDYVLAKPTRISKRDVTHSIDIRQHFELLKMNGISYFHPKISKLTEASIIRHIHSKGRAKTSVRGDPTRFMPEREDFGDRTDNLSALIPHATRPRVLINENPVTSCVFPGYPSALDDTATYATSSNVHVCKICEKSFRASSLLDIHMRVHVGAKPFTCPICGHRATQKGNLKLHMKKHHGADLPPHIDLVPDCGIWGHPQDVTVVDGHDVGIDGCMDPSGKRKQVAQAVSSFLNEEVVELIKKYQNDVGQASDGTITESLEDFIRIARSRRTKDNMSTELNNRGCPKSKATKQKRIAFSVRFQPYDIKNGTGVQSQNTLPPSNSSPERCVVCKKHRKFESRNKRQSLYFRNSSDVPVCDRCSTDAHCSSQLSKSVAYFQRSSVKLIPAAKKGRSDVSDNKLSGCHAPFTPSARKQTSSATNERPLLNSYPSEKEKFLSLFNMTAIKPFVDDGNVEATFEMFEGGLDPLLTDIMLNQASSDKNASGKTYVKCKDMYGGHEQNLSICKAEENHRATKTENPAFLVESPGQKSVILPRDLTNEEQASSFSQRVTYRNPAMQSLAEIGQTLRSDTVPSIDSNYVAEPQTTINHEYPDWNVTLECPYCRKRYKYRSVLDIHMRSHTGKRPFKCPHCDYAGTQNNCLKLHIQRHHPTKCRYTDVDKAGITENENVPNKVDGSCQVSCPVCGRVSPSLGYLKIHMRSHKKRLDHICQYCGRGFKEYWYLSTHLKTHERQFGLYGTNLLKSRSIYQHEQYDMRTPLDHVFPNIWREKLVRDMTLVRENYMCHQPTPCDNDDVLTSNSPSSENHRNSLAHHQTQNSGIQISTLSASVTSTRPRRRKSACPSRIISSESVRRGPASPKESSDKSSEMEQAHSSNHHIAHEPDDVPLDLTCGTKKQYNA